MNVIGVLIDGFQEGKNLKNAPNALINIGIGQGKKIY